jgi:hypothetical protein
MDEARYDVSEALKIQPGSKAAQELRQQLAAREGQKR